MAFTGICSSQMYSQFTVIKKRNEAIKTVEIINTAANKLQGAFGLSVHIHTAELNQLIFYTYPLKSGRVSLKYQKSSSSSKKTSILLIW